MSITLIWWLIPVLMAAELGAVAWVRRDRYPRFLFHLWAPTGYAALLLLDLLLAVLLTALFGGGRPDAQAQQTALGGWAVAAALVLAATAGLTLFFRWVAHTEISE